MINKHLDFIVDKAFQSFVDKEEQRRALDRLGDMMNIADRDAVAQVLSMYMAESIQRDDLTDAALGSLVYQIIAVQSILIRMNQIGLKHREQRLHEIWPTPEPIQNGE